MIILDIHLDGLTEVHIYLLMCTHTNTNGSDSYNQCLGDLK